MSHISISSDSDSREQSASEEDTGESSYTEWKDDLQTCLDTIETAGDFAGFKTYSAFVNPGLEVSGSPIPLPLTLRDAQTLRSACRQAPYGKGEATLVDESVRKTWELGCDQFSPSNPEWHEFINTLVRDVVHPLGMTSVRAEPYKLLLYEEGSFFKKHKDSEKAPGMVGTLVICLPAKHEGGDVHLSHAGRERIYTTGQSSAFSLTALAWFSDVTHEIMQVTSGYRLVLTYNIIQSKYSGSSSAGFFSKQQKQLQRLISEWKVKYPETKRLLYCLEHKYTQSSLSLENLKGRDHAVCQTLCDTCLESGHYLLLVNLTYSEDDDYDESETSLIINSVYSTSGSLITEDIDVDEEEIIGENPYEARDPDSESEGEYTGNEGMASTHRYHDTSEAAMIVSRKYMFEILNEHGNQSALYWVIQPSLVNPSTDPSTRDFAVKFIKKMLKSPRGLDKAVLSDMYLQGVNLKLDNLLRKVLRASVTQTSTNELLITIAELINKTFRVVSSPQPEWDSWLGECVTCIESLTDLTSVLDKFECLLENDALKESFKNWRSSAEGKKLESKTTYEIYDHDYIMNMIVSHPADLNWIQSNLIPKLVERGSKALLYILVGWLLKPDPEIDFKHSVTVSKAIVEAAQEKFVLEIADFAAPRYAPSGELAQLPRAFVQFIGNCLKQGFTEQVERLLASTSSRIINSLSEVSQPPTMDAQSVEQFMQSLASTLQKHKIAPLPSVGELFEALIRSHILVDAPTYPEKLPGWAHKPRGCKVGDCNDCNDLDKFLGSTDEIEARFSINEKRRKHLECRLLGTYGTPSPFRCTTDKKRAPYTLVVTKLSKGKEFEDDLKRYQLNLNRFEERVRPLQQDYVKQLMGEARYRELVMLESIPTSDGGTQLAIHEKKTKADDSVGASKPKKRRRK